MVKHTVLIFLSLIASALTCNAADGYYCAADDAQLKLSVDLAFDQQPDWPLNDLRGIIVFNQQVPTVGKTVQGILMLKVDDVVEYQRKDKSMLIRTSSKSGAGDSATDVDVLLDTKKSDVGINSFSGRYTVVVRPIGNNDPKRAQTRSGTVICSLP